MADRLHHLDRHDLVELAGEVAVVAELHVDAVREAGGGDAPAGEVELLAGDRDGGHVAAVGAGGVERPAAPAGTDLEHAIAGGEAELAAQGVVLLPLRRLEGEIRRGGGPLRGGIHQRGIEKEGEEIVREIVVLADVAAGGGAGVGTEQMAGAIGEAQQVERERPRALRTGQGRRVFQVEDEPGDDRGEIRSLPVPVDERLGEPDVARPEALFEKGLAAHGDVRLRGQAERKGPARGVRMGAEFVGAAVGQLDAQMARVHGPEGAEHRRAKRRGFGAMGERGKVGGGGVGTGVHTGF